MNRRSGGLGSAGPVEPAWARWAGLAVFFSVSGQTRSTEASSSSSSSTHRRSALQSWPARRRRRMQGAVARLFLRQGNNLVLPRPCNPIPSGALSSIDRCGASPSSTEPKAVLLCRLAQRHRKDEQIAHLPSASLVHEPDLRYSSLLLYRLSTDYCRQQRWTPRRQASSHSLYLLRASSRNLTRQARAVNVTIRSPPCVFRESSPLQSIAIERSRPQRGRPQCARKVAESGGERPVSPRSPSPAYPDHSVTIARPAVSPACSGLRYARLDEDPQSCTIL